MPKVFRFRVAPMSRQAAFRAAAIVLVFAIILISFEKPRVQAAPSGAGWTAIIIGGVIVLYEFGYRYPIDNKKIKGAWREAEIVAKSSYDSRTELEIFTKVGAKVRFAQLQPTIVITFPDQTQRSCTMTQITDHEVLLPVDTCVYDASDPSRPRIRASYVIGAEYTLNQLRGQAIETVVNVPKARNGDWRSRYEALRTCWNKLIYVDPSPSPTPKVSASPSASPKSSPSPNPEPKKTIAPSITQKSKTLPHEVSQLRPVSATAARSTGSTDSFAPGSSNSNTPTKATSSATPSPTPSPAIQKGACTFDLAAGSANLDAPNLIDVGDSSKSAVYVDLIEATDAFDNASSLRQQIIDERVGPNVIVNLERAEVLARLEGIFYATSLPSPHITYTLKPTSHGVGVSAFGSPAPTSSTGLASIENIYKSCGSPIDPQACIAAVQAPEQQLVGTIATKNACAFASDYWLPTISAIGAKYGPLMKNSTKDGYTEAPIGTGDTAGTTSQTFGAVPGC